MPFYVLCVALIAFSPVIGALVGTVVGLPVNFQSAIAFTWVGVVSSLPASLGVAKAFGDDQLEAYWRYLESFPNTSRKSLKLHWAVASLASLIVGILALLMS
jgi:hypothetical protein